MDYELGFALKFYCLHYYFGLWMSVCCAQMVKLDEPRAHKHRDLQHCTLRRSDSLGLFIWNARGGQMYDWECLNVTKGFSIILNEIPSQFIYRFVNLNLNIFNIVIRVRGHTSLWNAATFVFTGHWLVRSRNDTASDKRRSFCHIFNTNFKNHSATEHFLIGASLLFSIHWCMF